MRSFVQHASKQSTFYRLGLCIIVGLGVRFGYGPLDSHLLGLLAPLCLLALLQDLSGAWKEMFLWAIVLQVAVHTIAFSWMFAGLRNIGHMSFLPAAFFFVLSALLVQIKFTFFLFLARLFRFLPLHSFFGISALATLSDAMGGFLFPWHWGNLAAGSDAFRQLASLPGGVHLLSFLFFLEAVLLFWAIQTGIAIWKSSSFPKTKERQKRSGKKRPNPKNREQSKGLSSPGRRLLPDPQIILIVFIILAAWFWGNGQLQKPELYEKKIQVALLQPALPPALQKYKGERAYATLALNRFFGLGMRALLSATPPELLLYPESAVPFYTSQTQPRSFGKKAKAVVYSPTFHAVLAMLSRLGQVDIIYNELVPAPSGYFNSASVFSFAKARRIASYYKRQLIPFGEYLPAEDALPVLRSLFSEVSYYKPGQRAFLLPYRIYAHPETTLQVTPDLLEKLKDPKLVLQNWPHIQKKISEQKKHKSSKRDGHKQSNPLSHYILPLICYEGTFSSLTRDFFLESKKRPDFLANLSNDVWFASEQEVYQHALAARLRAVETGRYLLRANMSGYSAVYDTKGRVQAGPLLIAKPGILVAQVPLLPNAQTPYLEYGKHPLFFLLGFLVIMDFGMLVYKRKESSSTA